MLAPHPTAFVGDSGRVFFGDPGAGGGAASDSAAGASSGGGGGGADAALGSPRRPGFPAESSMAFSRSWEQSPAACGNCDGKPLGSKANRRRVALMMGGKAMWPSVSYSRLEVQP